MTCISLILKLKKWIYPLSIDNVCLLFLSGILRTTSLFQFQFSTQKFFRESWQCFQQSLANSSSWSATTLWERYSSKFDNYWDCLSLISAPKVMDLLALGNSAANFLLYCIMSTQVSLHLRLNSFLLLASSERRSGRCWGLRRETQPPPVSQSPQNLRWNIARGTTDPWYWNCNWCY